MKSCGLSACVASISVRFWSKKTRNESQRPPSFVSCLLFHFLHIQKLSKISLCSETTRKHLLRRLVAWEHYFILATLGSSLWQYWNVTIDWAVLDCIPVLSYSSVGILYNTLVSLSPWAQDLTSRNSTFKLYYGWKQDYRKTILSHQFVTVESLFLAVHISH